ncbi:hypothetical protein G5B31_10515 [Rhodobacter sp. SGA-6-6]|uniref:pilus assembly protein TadG-related protein n=1 Tax=Rhodobacter sp. SGA-6-6 TaxID=2710882 RepID=UPI0013E9B83D|nr:pilus assembly protein TadG-related protein [Rhodobacter sp. SGA-6-6]NGM45974.1 hypothetical protein [Rhodobacter sp. SGA-6-6]
MGRQGIGAVMAARLEHFLRDTAGAISTLVVMLFPLLLVIGGLATDVSLLNAQKRYVQSQADLAAQSAARYLPDAAKARDVARGVVARNTRYGAIALADADIEIGSYDAETGAFRKDQGASAVRVVVPSPFDPILLASILPDKDLTIRRSAVGTQQATVVFTLRNRLLGLDTRRSVLDGVLGPLGLGLTTNVLGYEGLANTRVKVDELLGLATLGLATEALTFDDVLDLPIAIPRLLGGLVGLGKLPPAAVPTGAGVGPTVTLDEILAMSPGLARLKVGDVLPDLSLNALDLLTAFAGLAAQPAQRIGVTTGLDLGPLANVTLDLGLIRPPVTAIGLIGDQPPPQAKVAQTDVSLRANALNLIRVTLGLQLAEATATALSLNCGAAAASDTLASFQVSTAPATLALRVRLLQLVNGTAIERDAAPVPVAGVERQVDIRLDQFRQPVAIANPISVSGVTGSLSNVLSSLRSDVNSHRPDCGPLGLGCLVGSLLGNLLNLVNGLVNSLTGLIANTLQLDNIAQNLLDALGIRVAQADLILDDYSCQARLVQ